MPLKLSSSLDMSKIVKSLGQKYKLVPHLDLALAQEDFDWEFKYRPKQGDDAWHPSGDCTPSLRDLYLKAKGQMEPDPISGGLRKIFMVGHFWHQYLQWVVEHQLGFAGPEDIERRGTRRWDIPGRLLRGDAQRDMNVQHKPYHWATGSGDIAPCRIPGHGDYVVDFKTQRSQAFRQATFPDWCAGKYEAQINVYMDFFDAEKALIVCIDKDGHDMKEYEYHRNQPLIDAVYTKWKIVSECLDEGILPPEDEDIPLPLRGPVVT